MVFIHNAWNRSFESIRISRSALAWKVLNKPTTAFAENHQFDDRRRLIRERGITIGDECWLGSGCVILDGVLIGKGSVIAAGCVVTKSVPPYIIVAGIPGRVIRERGESKKIMIAGVQTKSLKVIPDERGRLMEMLRCDDPEFSKFGQVYMTSAYPGVIKGWHYHHIQNDGFVVVKGMIKLVLYDRRSDSPTFGEIDQFFLGEHNPMLVNIPCEVAHGFKGIGIEEAIIINIVTEPYDYQNPDEYHIDPHGGEIPYDWDLKDY
jgi:dTDP-4-dehydrorhamnose 3,5-epimerase